jgi:hypothetical protein
MTNLKKAAYTTLTAIALTATAAFATVPAQQSCAYTLSSTLRLGTVNPAVMTLQKVLNMDAATQVAASGAGSTGFETARFGPATFVAVKKFQAANGITPVSGYVGAKTLAVLNSICNGSTPTTPTSTTTTPTVPGPVSANTVSIAQSLVPVSTLVQGQASAKIGEFVVTGNGNVTAMELMRIGISNNTTLNNVYLYDGATRITDAASVLTDGTIRFVNGYGLFPVSGSKTITVRADIAGLTSGQTVGVAMKSVTLAGSAATMITGVNGPLFAIASASTAGVTFTGSNTVSNANVNAGTLNYNVWGGSFSVATRAVGLKGLTFKMIGSAPVGALANVKLYLDGVQSGMATANPAGLLVFDMNANPKLMSTGGHTVELRADVVGGANRNFYVSVENVADMLFEDTTLPGVFVTPAGFSTVKNAGTITINTGNLTINQDPAFVTTNVVGGATNVTIGAFKVTSYGEDTKLQTVSVNPVLTGTTPAAAGLNNVALFVNGGQVGSSVNWTSGTLTFTLGSQFIAMTGTPVTLEVKADVVTNGNVVYSAGTVRADIVAVANGAQGIQSSNLVNIPGIGGKTLTINGSNPTFSKSSGFVNQAVAPNANVKIGSFILQNGNVEDVTLNNLVVNLAGTMALTNLSNLTIKDGATAIGTPFGTVSAVNNFSSSGTVIAKNSSKTFDVYADLGSATAVNVMANMMATYRGNTSFVNTTTPTVTGVTTTVGTAVLAYSINSATTDEVAQFVVGGTMKKIVTYKVTSTNNIPANVNRMTFAVTSPDAIQSIKVGGVTASVAGGVADVTGLNLTVPGTPAGVTVPVEVTYACFIGGAVGSGCNLTNSPATPINAQVTLTAVEALSGSASVGSTGLTLASNVMKLVASKPTVTIATSPTNAQLVSGTNVVLKFTVSADAGGDVALTALPWTLGGSAAPTVVTAVKADGANITSLGTITGLTGFTFTAPRTISAGTSVTFEVEATVGATPANSSAIGSVTPSTGLLWNDVIGGGAALTGASINNYPTNTYSIHN